MLFPFHRHIFYIFYLFYLLAFYLPIHCEP